MSTAYEINTPNVISESLGNETVIINLETGTYHHLNGNAARIWQHLQHAITTDVLVQGMAAGSPERASTLTQALPDFLAQLVDQGLIRESTCEPIAQPCPAITLDDSALVCESFTDMQDLLGLDPIHEADPNAGWPHQPPT